jgi:metallo-beta-lactamase family protein
MSSLQFLGAAGTVTGSRFVIEHEGRRIMVDVGLFQGPKELRQRNWARSPLAAKDVDAVVLTHAHIDHTGGLPRLVAEGFTGPVFTTPATRSLAGLLLPDSAHLQEEEARFANKHRYSRHSPALPLYTVADAHNALKLFETFPYARTREIVPGISLTFVPAGHILGSAICVIDLQSTRQRVVFTGDLGRYDAPILQDPVAVDRATTLVVESTYGNRDHGPTAPNESLENAVGPTLERGGMVVIPAFAIGRTQEILFHLRQLEADRKIPEVDVFVDSPMACDATPLYLEHSEEHDLAMRELLSSGRTPLATRRTHFVTAVNDSKRLNTLKGPGIIVSASGMATGGRILHHLKHRLPQANNTVLFVGYQSEGTRGRRLLNGEKEIKIHGELVPVAAEIRQVTGFSAHADRSEMQRWLQGFQTPPAQTLLVHGEPAALEALRGTLAGKGWPVYVPRHLEKIELKS